MIRKHLNVHIVCVFCHKNVYIFVITYLAKIKWMISAKENTRVQLYVSIQHHSACIIAMFYIIKLSKLFVIEVEDVIAVFS